VRWTGARQLEVLASPDGGVPVVLVETGKQRLDGLPALDVGLVWKGRTLRAPDHVVFEVLGNRFDVHAGVFWQSTRGPVRSSPAPSSRGSTPTRRAGVRPVRGAGLFTVALARAVGPTGVVTAVERSGPAVADLTATPPGSPVEVVRGDVRPALIARRLGRPDLVVLDPARAGAGARCWRPCAGWTPPRVVWRTCPASRPIRRDLKQLLAAGWRLGSLRAFDLFPMTEHVELVGILERPAP